MLTQSNIFYPSEWYPQDAILLAWPNSQTDWQINLDEAVKTYVNLISTISEYQKVVILCHNKDEVRKHLIKANIANIILVEEKYNDTWTRDYGPVTVFDKANPKLLDFRFNGWGNKYNATLDNEVTKKLYESSLFSENTGYVDMLDFVIEGGSIDTDGNGTLLTTSRCLLSKQRNQKLTKQQIEKKLMDPLNIQNILWLDNGDIEGDDTDGHIDTLAKFCNKNTIVYASCDEKQAPHYTQLAMMEQELKQMRNIKNEKYDLVKLPLPEPKLNSENKRLPATYVNFLITNEAVLVPAYKDKMDKVAEGVLRNIFTDKKIILIDCLSLIEQFGSLHCITMQLPKTTLKIHSHGKFT